MRSNFSKALKNNNFLSLSNNIGTAVIGFLSFIILARYLTPNIFGEWVLYIALGNFFEMLRFGLTRTAIIRFLSGAKGDEREKLIGTNWALGLAATIILALLIWLAFISFPETIKDSGYLLFFVYYPILSFVNLPHNMATSVMHADQKFGKILFIRMLNVGVFLLFLILNSFVLKWGLIEIIYIHILINLIVSLISMVYKWDGYQHIFKANKETNKLILNFGKYSTGTLIGANLLKSSDQILLGLSPFIGTAGVALYAVPLRLTEILEIPLRSFAATAFPKISKASIENNMKEVRRLFYSFSGALTFIILPVIVVGFIFAEQFVYILGGPEYIQTQNIFRIFCVYGLFIAIDKFTGITLDSINRPKMNFIKVIYMASANVLGDIFVIFYIGKLLFFASIITFIGSHFLPIFNFGIHSYEFTVLNILEMVAIVTILFTIIGIVVGLYYLNKDLKIKLKFIFIYGWRFFITIIKDVKSVFIV